MIEHTIHMWYSLYSYQDSIQLHIWHNSLYLELSQGPHLHKFHSFLLRMLHILL